MTLRLGTRGSALARSRATAIAGAFSAVARTKGLDLDFDLHVVTTSDNASRQAPCNLPRRIAARLTSWCVHERRVQFPHS